MRKTVGLVGNALEDVIPETVHDGHGFARDAGVRVDLAEDFVDVDGIALPSLALPLLVGLRHPGRLGTTCLGGMMTINDKVRETLSVAPQSAKVEEKKKK